MSQHAQDRQAYQDLHDQNPHYQSNNWLLDEVELLAALPGDTLVEIGCGNGRLLAAVAHGFERVIGVDWARSPVLDEVLASHPNVAFVEADLVADPLPDRADVVVSADVLEHIHPEHLDGLVARLAACATRQFHKIACYPDEWRHPALFEPGAWIARFQAIDPAFRLRDVEHRRGRADQPVAVVTRAIPDAPEHTP